MSFFHPEIRPKIKTWNGARWEVAEEKLNGHRMTLTIESDGTPRAMGRKYWIDQWEEISFLPLAQHFKLSMPVETVLDCELMAPGVAAAEVVTLLKAKDPRLELRPFALPILNGVSYRLALPQFGYHLLRDNGFTPPKHALFSNYASLLPDKEHTIAVLLSLAKSVAAEGMVLKRLLYRDWWKLKPYATIDCIVGGITPGKGKLSGLTGALQLYLLDQDGKRVDVGEVGTGFAQHERCFGVEVIGKVIEVAAEGIGRLGGLKFPSFIRWRDDKPAEECTIDQLENLPTL